MKSMTGFGNGSRVLFRAGGRRLTSVQSTTVFSKSNSTCRVAFSQSRTNCGRWLPRRSSGGRLEVFLALSDRLRAHMRLFPILRLRKRIHRLRSTSRVRSTSRESSVSNFSCPGPEVFQVAEAHQPSSTEINASKNALQSALTALERQRRREGKFLQRDLRQRIGTLAKIRRSVGQRSKHTQQATRQKLADKVSDLLPQLDSDRRRVLQDVASLVQKSDITEEFVRLQSHLAAFSDLLRLEEPVGKRMDFLLQEMQREVNTIGAKADDASIRHLVVQAKEEVEKIREQVQNIE